MVKGGDSTQKKQVAVPSNSNALPLWCPCNDEDVGDKLTGAVAQRGDLTCRRHVSLTSMDWQQVEEAASIVLRDGKLPIKSKEAIKRALASKNDPLSVLEALCVLDSLALNCGRTLRAALAAPKWMKRMTQSYTSAPQTAPAVAQLLANWELTFRLASQFYRNSCCRASVYTSRGS